MKYEVYYAFEMPMNIGSDDLEEAIEMAREEAADMVVVFEDGKPVDRIDTRYDSFRVSAVWADGTTIDNDIVHAIGGDVIDEELYRTDVWHREEVYEGADFPEEYMIQYYFNGEVVGTEMVKA